MKHITQAEARRLARRVRELEAEEDRRRSRWGVAMSDSATLSTVITKLRGREALGLRKYGVSIDRTDLSHLEWLQHALEEGMDKMLYLQRAIDTATTTSRRAMLQSLQRAEQTHVIRLQWLIDTEVAHG